MARSELPDYVGAYFPVMAADGQGHLALAHWDPDGRMQVYTSSDGAGTWDGPVQWSGEAPTSAAPWVEVRDGVASLAYYDESGIGFARGSIVDGNNGPTQRGQVADGIIGGGDFVHFALDASGAMLVPIPDAQSRVLSVAAVAPPT